MSQLIPKKECENVGRQDRVPLSKCQCCFCGRTIGEEEGFELGVFYDEESTQGLWTHAACLKEKLHPSVPVPF